jgi:hypothetical protein
MAAARGFAARVAREEPQLVVLRWLTVVVCSAFALFGGFAGYRAWVQVRSVELRPTTRVLAAGSTVTVDAVSWAGTDVTVRLLLVQGTHAESLAVRVIGTNAVPSLDPRWRRESITVAVPGAVLARFQPGSARLVATAVGLPQWMRTPPAAVREREVVLGS